MATCGHGRFGIGIALGVFLACAAGLWTEAAWAQSEDDGERTAHGHGGVRQLPPVTVTATRNPVDPFVFPGMVTVLGRPEIRARQPSSPDDLLKYVPGVEFTGGPRRTGEAPSIRGFEGADVIVTIDGARQNFGSTHDGRFFVDPSLLRSVEVLRGPASSLYGSGGTGGLIAFETVDAADLLDPGRTAGVMISGGYQSVHSERAGNVTAFSAPGEGTDLIASITRRVSGTIRLGDGNELQDTDDDILAGLVKIGLEGADHHRVEGSFVGFRNDATEPNNGQEGIGRGETAVGLVEKGIRATTVSVAYHYDNPADRLVDLDLVAYRTRFRADELRIEGVERGPVGELLTRDVDTTGLRLDNRSRVPVSERMLVTLTYGAEYWNDSQDGGDGGTRMGTPDADAEERDGVPDADARFAGLFAQAEIGFSEPFGAGTGRLLLIPGARYDSYTMSSSGRLGTDNEQSELSPKLGVSWLPSERFMLFAGYAHAFRAPTVNELYLTGIHFPVFRGRELVGFNRFEPSPDLKPQATRTLEGGAGITFDDVITRQDRLRFKATVFRIRGEDFIDVGVRQVSPPAAECIPFVSDRSRIPAGPPGTFRRGCEGTSFSRNVPNARLRGTEIDAAYDSDRFRMVFGFSSIDGENRDTGARLGMLVPDQFTASVTVQLPEIDSVLGWSLLWADDFPDDPATTGADRNEARAGYDVHDLHVSWRPDDPPFDGLEVDFGIDNVFDKAYNRVNTAAVEPGRSFKILARYSRSW